MARLDGVDGRELAALGVVDGDDDGLADGRRRALEERPADPPDVEVFGDQQADPGQVRADTEPTRLVGRGEQAEGGHVVEDPMRRAARDVGRAGEIADAPFARLGEGLQDAHPARHRAARGPLATGGNGGTVPPGPGSQVRWGSGRLTRSGWAWHSEHTSRMGLASR